MAQEESCPDENVLLALVERQLTETERRAVAAHLEGCPSCLAVTADLAATDPKSAPDPLAIHPDTRIGRYELIEFVGQGGMGSVYAAHDTQLDRRIALKLLRFDRPGADGAAARLLREARAMARLSHPNVVAVHDAGEADGRTFVAMEFVAGVTFAAWLRESQRTWRAVLEKLLLAGRGLAAAHAAGIVHRDFKPENVLIDGEGRVRVSDFGLAAIAQAELLAPPPSAEPLAHRRNASITTTGAVLGTPRYMSPEQHGGRRVDARTDQFSFAVAAYEALYGQPPFAGSSPAALQNAVDEGRVAPPPPGADVPAAIRAILLRGLASDPDDRYPTLDALLADLTTVLESASQRPRDRLLGRGRRLAWPLAGSVLVVAAVGLIAARGRTGAISRRAEPSPTLPAQAASASATPVALLDLPAPLSSNAAALADYAEGLRNYRDGQNNSYQIFRRAVAEDPTLTAAHLRIVIELVDVDGPDNHAGMVAEYRSALAGRDRLTARDRGILDALAPVILPQPADWSAAASAVRALTETYPTDADLASLLGRILLAQDHYAEARAELARARSLDPALVPAWLPTIDLQLLERDLAGAETSSQACLAASPRATTCLTRLRIVSSLRGDCETAERLAQRFVVTSPEDPAAYLDLFDAEVARGEPGPTLDTTLALLIAHLEPEFRTEASIRFAWDRAVFDGDFVHGEELLGEHEKNALREGDVGDVLVTLRNRAEMALETGNLAAAGRAADAYLKRKAALPPPALVDESELFRDATPWSAGVVRRAGTRSAGDARDVRDAWVRRMNERVTGLARGSVWLNAYARPAETREEAEEALRLAPPDLLPFLAGMNIEAEAVGRVYLLAGKTDLALPFLRSAAAQCAVRRFPLQIPRARYLLGLAEEAQGDREAACRAYRGVRDRWGGAKPRSVSAIGAEGHARALRCVSEGGASGARR